MAQIFHSSTNTISRLSIFLGVILLFSLASIFGTIARSPYITQASVVREQPVPFSHKHHVNEVGLDCRYCHTSVEESSFAGIPPTKTCMNCHSQIWSDSPMLEPVRQSFRSGKSLEWVRVHELADYVYFNHSIHVKRGVGCTTCHGQVDQMPLMYREATLLMEWCLDCHRAPEKYLRPLDKVFDVAWKPPENQLEAGLAFIKERGVQRLSDCSTCHR